MNLELSKITSKCNVSAMHTHSMQQALQNFPNNILSHIPRR